MEITRRVTAWSAPKPITEPHACDITATHVLMHAVPSRSIGRKPVPATAVSLSSTGKLVYLCAYCASYVELWQWLDRLGVSDDIGGCKLAVLGFMWRAECGYVVPTVRDFRGGCLTAGMLAFQLRGLLKDGLIKRVGDRYLMRDACHSCLKRACDKECGLRMGEEFAQRREPAYV
jgi:hypothetical protein